MKQKFAVTGMTCSACSANVEKKVQKIPGVDSVNVNLLANSMTVDFDADKCDSAEIINAVANAGYGASLFESAQAKAAGAGETQIHAADSFDAIKTRIIISIIFLLPLMYISTAGIFALPLPSFLTGRQNTLSLAFLQFLLVLPIVYSNQKYYQIGFRTLIKRAPNMDSLIAVGTSAALIYGIFAIFMISFGLGHNNANIVDHYGQNIYLDSAAMILTLITLGKFLEARSKGRTSEAISKLVDLAPKTATVIREGMEHEIAAQDVIVGDTVIVKPGQRVPVDGVVIEGISSVDQSALTGESIPVEKGIGDKISAATINKSGYIKFRAERVGENTTLAQIIQLVEEAGSSKAPIGRLADKIAAIFVPTVMSIALISFIIWLIWGPSFEFALTIGISVLIISCPCALGLATPVAIMAGTGVGAENGILIKSAEYLEAAHAINTVVLDKTGTITEGKPKVTDIIPLAGMNAQELLEIAHSLEKPSEHPLADAINIKAMGDNISAKALTDFQSLPGRGVSAIIDGNSYLAGNSLFMTENGIDITEVADTVKNLAKNGKTPLYFAGKELIGIIAAADTIKPSSITAIEGFKSVGADVVMLTGDNERTALAIAKKLNIDKTLAEVLPQDKEREIRALQQKGQKVAMIGDGINDAPALVRADVGIAIGAGTDIAIESADIVLIRSELVDAVTAIKLSKEVIKKIKQNLFWAFFYNSIGIPVAAGVLYPSFGLTLSPVIAALAMSASSVSVVVNALRLRLFQPFPAEITANQKTIIKGDDEMKKVLTINGMNCGHCQAAVEKALDSIGIRDSQVDWQKKTAIIEKPAEINDQDIKDAIEKAGYEVVAIE